MLRWQRTQRCLETSNSQVFEYHQKNPADWVQPDVANNKARRGQKEIQPASSQLQQAKDKISKKSSSSTSFFVLFQLVKNSMEPRDIKLSQRVAVEGLYSTSQLTRLQTRLAL